MFKNGKEKKKQKKKEEMEWAIAHWLFMLGFTRHKYPSMGNFKSITFATC
jgi:hypothetical protein